MREDYVKEITIGVPVECTDGPAGKTTNLIVDPKSLAVTHYVVKEAASPHAERGTRGPGRRQHPGPAPPGLYAR